MKIIKDEKGLNGFPYIAFVPDNVSANPALLVQLHGAGERGDGGDELEKVLVHGFSKIANDDNLKDCILIMPQCPNDSFWVAKIESLRKFIDKTIAEHSIDESRVYLTGISMGGFGTWYTAMAYPELFAAIAPCCGGGMAWNSEVLKMPVWAFHGLSDTVVSPNHTIEMVEKLKLHNQNLKYSLFEKVGHNAWDYAFNEELLSWIISQKRVK